MKGGVMRKREYFILPLFMVITYISAMPKLTYGQGNPDIPLDESGEIFMRQLGYSLYIYGQVYDREAPSWQELLEYSMPECAHINLV
jgi:hypothetical protein